MFSYFANAARVISSLKPQESTASAGAINGTAIDISGAEGPILVTASAPVASSGDTITFTVEHSEASGSGFVAVGADFLVDPDTGDPATFTVVTDAVAIDQTLALKHENLKRYVRVVATTAGSGIDVFFGAWLTYFKKYAG